MTHLKKVLLLLVSSFLLTLSMKGLAEELPEDWTIPGNTVVYGMLEQDNNFDNGPEPLEWIVLTCDGENSLVITRDAVVLYRFGIFTVQPQWTGCEARVLLNENFIESTFTEEECARILFAKVDDAMSYPHERGDRLFLLSEEEYVSYLAGMDGARAAYTPFVRATMEARLQSLAGKKSVRIDELISRNAQAKEAWWLRTALEYVDTYDGGMGTIAVEQVLSDGTIKSDDPGYTAALRPAMWVKVRTAEPTPEPTPEPTSASNDLPQENANWIENLTWGDYTYTCFYDECWLTGYSGTETDIVIPSEINGYPVTKLDGTFSYNMSIQRVVVSEGVEEIWNYAFDSCENLREVTLPSTLRELGLCVFSGCIQLEKINLPDGLTILDDSAFYHCDSLTSISIPDTVEEIGPAVLMNCTGLVEVKLPEGLRAIPSQMFQGCTSLQSIRIPDFVDYIADQSFANCTALQTVLLPPGKEVLVEKNAFAGTPWAAHQPPKDNVNVKIVQSDFRFEMNGPDGTGIIVDYIGTDSHVIIPAEIDGIPITGVANNIFRVYPEDNPAVVESLVVEEGITTIDPWAFAWVNTLRSVTLPSSVKYVGECAFADCSNLETVMIPDTASVADNAFYGCNAVEIIRYSYAWKDYTYYFEYGECVLTGYNGTDTNIIVPSEVNGCKVTEMDGTFTGNTFIESVVVPEGVNQLLNHTFSGCVNLRSVTLPSTLQNLGWYTFTDCASLEEIILPTGLESIGEKTFSHCSNLERIIVPDTVYWIGDSAFAGCESLTALKLPEALQVISGELCLDCKNLTSIQIPKNVEHISYRSFSGCSALQSVQLPSSNQVLIVESAFAGTPWADSTPYRDMSNVTVGQSEFEYSYGYDYDAEQNYCVILAYLGTDKHVVIPASIDGLPVYCVESLQAEDIESIVLEEGIRYVPAWSFEYQRNLRSVVMPSTIEWVGYAAFSHCNNLETVLIPDTAEVDDAFEGCENVGIIRYTPGFAPELPPLAPLTPTPAPSLTPSPTPKPTPEPTPTPNVIDFSAYDLFSFPETSLDNFYIEGHTCTADGIIEDRYGMYVINYIGANKDIRLPEMMYCNMSDRVEDVCLILDGAFASTGVERVVLPQYLSFIGDKAFANCTSLREIAILCPWAKISATAFEGCSEDLIIYGYRGSEAEEAAEILGCYFEAIGE